MTSALASYCYKTGETEKGLQYLNSAINLFPFEPSLWHSKVDVYFQFMSMHFNNGEYEKANKYLTSGLNIIDEALERNKINMNPFVFNENTVERLQIMEYMKDNWNHEAIKDINGVVHYSILNLDMNLDGMTDQWRISNTDLISASIVERGMALHTNGRSYLYTRYPIKLKRAKTYRVEMQLENPVEYIS